MKLFLAFLALLLIAAGPPEDVGQSGGKFPDAGITCWKLGYDKPDTLPDEVSGVVDGRNLTLTAPEGTTGDICVKGGNMAPVILTVDEAREYEHPQDVSHWGHLDIVLPEPEDPKEEDPKEEDPKEEDPKEEDPKEDPKGDDPEGETPTPDVIPRDCAAGPDPGTDEWFEAEEWRAWHEENCEEEKEEEVLPVQLGTPQVVDEQPVVMAVVAEDLPISLPETGIPAVLLLLLGSVLVGSGVVALRVGRD